VERTPERDEGAKGRRTGPRHVCRCRWCVRRPALEVTGISARDRSHTGSGRSSDSRARLVLFEASTGRRFPDPAGPSAYDGGRSRSPLRGSPGFPPGSLLRRIPPGGRGEPAASAPHAPDRRPGNHVSACRTVSCRTPCLALCALAAYARREEHSRSGDGTDEAGIVAGCPFVGREEVLGELRDALARAAAGRGGLVSPPLRALVRAPGPDGPGGGAAEADRRCGRGVRDGAMSEVSIYCTGDRSPAVQGSHAREVTLLRP
jgi:hypothetical protein